MNAFLPGARCLERGEGDAAVLDAITAAAAKVGCRLGMHTRLQGRCAVHRAATPAAAELLTIQTADSYVCPAVQRNQESKSNGCLMRCAPLAVWGHRLDAQQLAAAARADCRLTNPNHSCQVGLSSDSSSGQQRQLVCQYARLRAALLCSLLKAVAATYPALTFANSAAV